MRNLGYSIFDIFFPVSISVFTIGIIFLILINPLSAKFDNKFEKILDKKEKRDQIKKQMKSWKTKTKAHARKRKNQLIKEKEDLRKKTQTQLNQLKDQLNDLEKQKGGVLSSIFGNKNNLNFFSL